MSMNLSFVENFPVISGRRTMEQLIHSFSNWMVSRTFAKCWLIIDGVSFGRVSCNETEKEREIRLDDWDAFEIQTVIYDFLVLPVECPIKGFKPFIVVETR